MGEKMKQIAGKILCMAAAAVLTVNTVYAANADNNSSADAYSAFEQVAGYASELYIDSSVTQEDVIIGAAKKFIEDYPEYADKFPPADKINVANIETVKKTIAQIIGNDEDMLVVFFKCALRSLDKYSDFFTAEEYESFAADLNQRFYGIGVVIRQEGSRVEVQGFTDNSAAKAAGVQEGDVFKKVDGEEVLGLSLQEVRARILGELGEPVKVTFLRGDDEYTVTVNRCEVRGDTVSYEIIDDSVGYIRITDMADDTDNEFWVALGEMDIAGVSDIIIDLRYNGGGFLQTAIDLSREIVPFGLICSTNYRVTSDRITNYYSYVEEPKYRIKVLVNDSTASAAEIFASAVQESGCGQIYGETTYGKGVIQSTYTLANKSVMKITTGKYLTRNGNDINNVGIIPDVEVSNRLVSIDISQYTPFDFETEWMPGMSGEGVLAAKEKLCLLGYYDGYINSEYGDDFAESVAKFRDDNDAGEGSTIDIELQKLIDEKFSELEAYEDTQLETVLELFKYSDIDDYTWAHTAIADMSAAGAVQGTGDGMFSPDTPVTRAEFAAMLVRVFGIESDSAAEFPDVAADEWYYEYINKAAGAGIIKGDENGYFNPEEKISRQDMALLLKRAAGCMDIELSGNARTGFDDWESVDDYAKLAVTDIASAGIMTGTDSNRFAPEENATRVQAVAVLDRLADMRE